MTVIPAPLFGNTIPEVDAVPIDEAQRQQRAAQQRIADRAGDRSQHEDALQSPGGIAAANSEERLARRIDRIRHYRGGQTGPDTVLETIINTPDFVDVRYLDAGVAAARATGRVNIGGAGRGFGTGFMVSPSLLLTNHHVLPSAEVARTSVIEFNFQDGIDGAQLTMQPFPLDPTTFYLADRDRDFALVAVSATAAQLAPFGFNKLIEAEGKAVVGEFVTIVQHPAGRKKQIALRENRIVDIPELHLHYSADTEPGSSGSPVFNDQWEVVALHHASVRAPEQTAFGGFVNEGVRISRIVRFLREQPLDPARQALAAEVGASTASAADEALVSSPPADDTVTLRIPLEITVRLGTSTSASDVVVKPAEPEVARRADFSDRRGFDRAFLPLPIELPGVGALTSVASDELRYHHFSIVMHRARRLALFTAVNIDGTQAAVTSREEGGWRLDPRLPATEQVGKDFYTGSGFDRGHMVRRLDPVWGTVAPIAHDDTFHFTNAVPQRHAFNAGDELWNGLEDYILHNAVTHGMRVSVLTGPIFADDDPVHRGVAVPRRFWKVAAIATDDGALSITGYLLSQTALLEEFAGAPESFSFGAFRTFQVPVRRIARLTRLGMDSYFAADPLERIESTVLPRELVRHGDIIL